MQLVSCKVQSVLKECSGQPVQPGRVAIAQQVQVSNAWNVPKKGV